MPTLLGEKRRGSASLKGGGNKPLQWSYSIDYLVVTTPGETREDVLFTAGLPLVGLRYGGDAICMSKSADRDEVNTLYWLVKCEFDSAAEDQQQNPQNPSDDPTTWIAKATIGFETKSVVLTTDKSDPPKKIVNSAGTPFDTPLVEDRVISVISFTQYEEPSLSLNDITDRNNAVNSEDFRGYAARTIKLAVRKAELGFFGRYNAWKIDYEAKYDPDTWDNETLDVGPMYKEGAELLPFLDSRNTYRIVGYLEANGSKRAMTSDPLSKNFRVFKEISFSFIRV